MVYSNKNTCSTQESATITYRIKKVKETLHQFQELHNGNILSFNLFLKLCSLE